MRICLLLIPIILLAWTGCSRLCQPSRAFPTLFNNDKSITKVELKHQRAIEWMCDGDLCKAEQLLRDALVCEPSHGAIHNTLGKVYFQQRRYYLAAWEFEFAQKAMPDRPEPLNNMGMVYEAVDNFDQAIQYYEMAWASDGNNPEFLGNLVRARIRSGDRSTEVYELLKRLIEIEHRTQWVDWARGQLVFWNRNVTALETGKEPFYEDIPAIEFTPYLEGVEPAQLPLPILPGTSMDDLEPRPNSDGN